ncbi:hypothetical protein FAIPA1_170023 [Frankia sp. AiPs1]|uniref:terpene synthase family protein n=1 Tax=Frankia sp. AiPa1 TaxID=573492 RepID=UPI00202ADFAA|nr:terpene synthase family protein [Frankia sp. AiPa1]MCL9761698.1 terpene synthase family protein [Frankia sp. AiPa1]
MEAPSSGPVREFFLPELPRTLPFRYHPKAAQIEFASNGWVREYLADCFASESELLFFLRQRNGLYGPLTIPDAGAGRARDVADWYQFVTVIDTFVSDRTGLGADLDDALAVFGSIVSDFIPDQIPGQIRGRPRATAADEPRVDQVAYGRAARDLWRRISAGLSRAQTQRLVTALADFLRGCATEIDTKLAGAVPDYETCLAVRLDSFGCDFIELMTEYGAEVDLSDLRTELAEVHDHCRRQMIIVNDLLSWRKEHAQDDPMTVVRVLVEHDGLPLQAAVDRLCELVAWHEREYTRTRDALLAGPLGARADVRAYLGAVDLLMGGSQEFEYLTPRYFGDGAVWDGSTSGWIDLHAPVTRFRPTPLTTDERAPLIPLPTDERLPAGDHPPGGS